MRVAQSPWLASGCFRPLAALIKFFAGQVQFVIPADAAAAREKLDAELKESKSVKSTVQSVLKYLGKTAYEKALDGAFTALLAKVMA